MTPAIRKDGYNSNRLSCASKLKQTLSPLPFIDHDIPQLTAQIQPRVALLPGIDALQPSFGALRVVLALNREELPNARHHLLRRMMGDCHEPLNHLFKSFHVVGSRELL